MAKQASETEEIEIIEGTDDEYPRHNDDGSTTYINDYGQEFIVRPVPGSVPAGTRMPMTIVNGKVTKYW